MSVISKFERTHDKSTEIHLSKMKSLHAILTNSKEKVKIETLMQCNEVLKKLMEKVDKVPCRQEYFVAGTKDGNTTAVGEVSKIATRRDKSESRVHHDLPDTEITSEDLQAGKSSSSEPSSTDDEASPNNEWLPSHKNTTALEIMLSLDSLRDLYKCMDCKCSWTENGTDSFLHHITSEHFKKANSNWNRCSYCPFQGDGTPRDLVQHITMKHGHCQYQCAYCFFRGMACSYVVLHQNMFHANKLVRVLECNDLNLSPPAESELEPLESVVQPYICSQGSCGKVFYNPKDFVLHLEQQHSGVSSLTCHICNTTRLRAARLIAHYKFHSLSLYQCRHCQYGAEKEEEIHQHLCNMHHNLPPLTVLRHYKLTEQSAPEADFNQLKVVNLEQSLLGGVISRPSESTVGGIQSEIFAEEDTVGADEAADIPFRKQDAEKNYDSADGGVHEDDDVQVLYCQLGMKDEHFKCKTCTSNCSQLAKGSPVKESKNSANELIIESDSQDSSDSVILIDESSTVKEESKLTHEALLVSTPKNSTSQSFIQNAEIGSNIDCVRNACADSVKTTSNAHNQQPVCASVGPTVTEDSVTQADQQKQGMASGLAGEDLYLCGYAHCEYRVATKSQLWEHMYVCDLSCGGDLRCPHCSLPYKAFRTLINHLSVHGVPRYSCALCSYCDTAPTAVEKHLKHQHQVSCTETVPADRFHNNPDLDMFVVRPMFQGKGKAKHNPGGHKAKSVYQPEEIHLLPVSGILKEPIHCSECSFKTKECSNMKQHLDLHLERDVDPAEITTMEVLNSLVRLEKNEKMFDKMTKQVASSNIGVPKLTSSVNNNAGSARNADTTDDSGKSGEDIQDAASATKLKLTNHAGAQRAKVSVHDSSQPLTSSSSEEEVQDSASKPSKRAAALRARASIRDLSLSADVAATITYQPKMRAAAVQAMASIRDLSELAHDGSPISSSKDCKDSDYEAPPLKEKACFTSTTPQQKKKITSEEQNISCKDCGKKCINVHGLKLHIIKSHRRTKKWLCGYCHKGGSTEMAIKHHCHKRHPAMPELVKYNEGDTSPTLGGVRHSSMPQLVKYNEESPSLKPDKKSGDSNHGLPAKTPTAASSKPTRHRESLLEEANKETRVRKLLTEDKAHCCKRKSSQSTLLKPNDTTNSNKKFSVAESTAHCFECYECSFEALSLHALRKHFEREHQECEFRYIVKQSKLHRKRSDNIRTKTSAIRHNSTSSALCGVGHYVCMLCSARTDSEEQFHCNHHSVYHHNVEPKYYFETVGHKTKHAKFECQKCCFTSDNFEILKQHLQLHIKAFQMWLSAQTCDLEMNVVRHKFSDIHCHCRGMELENWTKSVVQGNLKVNESLSPTVTVSEKKDMQGTRCRIQKVSCESTTHPSVSSRLSIKTLPANKSKKDCAEVAESDNPNMKSSHSRYGRSPSPIDGNKLLIFTNYGGSRLRMSVNTFSKLHNIYPQVKVRDLKHEKLSSI